MKKFKIVLMIFFTVTVISCNQNSNDISKEDSSLPKKVNSYDDINKNTDTKLTINNFFTNDIYAIKLTRSEFDSIANMDTNDSNMIYFANSKGIYFDSGLIPIFVEKEKMIMVTYKFDFGTILTLETIQKELGHEIMLHYKSKIK